MENKNFYSLLNEISGSNHFDEDKDLLNERSMIQSIFAKRNFYVDFLGRKISSIIRSYTGLKHFNYDTSMDRWRIKFIQQKTNTVDIPFINLIVGTGVGYGYNGTSIGVYSETKPLSDRDCKLAKDALRANYKEIIEECQSKYKMFKIKNITTRGALVISVTVEPEGKY